ncbi:MAG TPA: ABC-2 family transporter protein [Gaiellaceae bacterium]|nr:ABC-2 family transporter protein [Gaiellaceae bacterium]
MRLYWEIARRGFRRYAAYPAATIAGVFTNTVFGFIQTYVMLAVFEQRAEIGAYDATDVVTYVWLAQALLMTIYIWGWFDVARRVRTGDVATDLHRPFDFQYYWLAHDLGRAGYHALFRGLPPFVFGALFFDLNVPRSPLTWLAFVLSVVLAVAISFAFRFLFNLVSFWLLDYRGAGVLAMVVSTFFSGMIIPIVLFPDWLEKLAWALPFAGMVQAPVEIFLRHVGGLEAVGLLALQAFWAVALLGLGRLAFNAGARRLVVQGG